MIESIPVSEVDSIYFLRSSCALDSSAVFVYVISSLLQLDKFGNVLGTSVWGVQSI